LLAVDEDSHELFFVLASLAFFRGGSFAFHSAASRSTLRTIDLTSFCVCGWMARV
jgi:hypothetical protein